MDVIALVLFIFIIVARRNAAYNPSMFFNKHININNKLLRKILIPKRSKLFKNQPEENRNKMVITPFILAIAPIIYIPIIFAKEKAYAQSINQIGFDLSADGTLNLIIFGAVLIALASAILLINTIKCYKTETVWQKIRFAIRIILTVAFTGGFVAGIVVLASM